MLKGLIVSIAMLVAGTAVAQDSGLQRLDTGDDGKGWEAVGRLDIDGHLGQFERNALKFGDRLAELLSGS